LDDLPARDRKAEDPKMSAAFESFEPVFFNNMVLILDTYFTHRSRTTEGKDGNPLNEVRVLCNSILENKSVLRADKSIKLKPETSVLKLPATLRSRFVFEPPQTPQLLEADFKVQVRLEATLELVSQLSSIHRD
jgi:hypothetical protein